MTGVECVIPDCRSEPIRDFNGENLHICINHAIAIAAYIQEVTEKPLVSESVGQRQMGRYFAKQRQVERAASRRQEAGWVYYLLVGDRIKIGYTQDVKQRLRAYPPNSPLLAVHPGTRETEQAMHERFAQYRQAGREWFRDAAELRDHIAVVVDQFGEPNSNLEWRGTTTRRKAQTRAKRIG